MIRSIVLMTAMLAMGLTLTPRSALAQLDESSHHPKGSRTQKAKGSRGVNRLGGTPDHTANSTATDQDFHVNEDIRCHISETGVSFFTPVSEDAVISLDVGCTNDVNDREGLRNRDSSDDFGFKNISIGIGFSFSF